MSLEKRGVQVRFEMVDCDKRNIHCIGDRFGGLCGDQKRADQSGFVCRRSVIDVAEINACRRQGFVDKVVDDIKVRPRRDFGHDAGIFAVNVYLAENNI